MKKQRNFSTLTKKKDPISKTEKKYLKKKRAKLPVAPWKGSGVDSLGTRKWDETSERKPVHKVGSDQILRTFFFFSIPCSHALPYSPLLRRLEI